MGATEAVHLKAKVLLVGVNHRVKTSLVRPTVLDTIDDRHIVALGAKVSKKTLELPRQDQRVRLDILLWDIAGSRGFRESLVDTFSHGAQGVFAVCDATDRRTIRDAERWIEGVFRHIGKRPVVLVAAVPDEPGRLAVTWDDLQAVAKKYGAACVYSSAGEKEHTDQAFRILGERITRSALAPSRVPPPAQAGWAPASPR